MSDVYIKWFGGTDYFSPRGNRILMRAERAMFKITPQDFCENCVYRYTDEVKRRILFNAWKMKGGADQRIGNEK